MTKKSKREIKQEIALWENFGGRIVRSGRLAPLTDYTRWYCFECKMFFLQRTREIIKPKRKRARTRCHCPPCDPNRRFRRGDNSNSNGHMCLPEWETWDLEIPQRPSRPV